MWSAAVTKAGTTDVDKVREAMKGLKVKAPSGFEVTMDPETQHLHKPVFIGEIKADGQMQLVWASEGPVAPMPWSPYIPR